MRGSEVSKRLEGQLSDLGAAPGEVSEVRFVTFAGEGKA